MHIAGGLYHELCETPKWNAQFGSGGRAAAAVSVLSPGSTLHTYASSESRPGLNRLAASGIKIDCSRSDVEIAFAYFHPLSDPHIEPSADSIPQRSPIRVSGEVVLRFGFVEGSSIVHAANAIYDPQTSRNPERFEANGSSAKRLALVMNELELCQYARRVEPESAAASIIAESTIDTVIVVKRGVRGASVYEGKGAPIEVPAYYSPRVFKIGTGDVFSAIFAHYWGEAGLSAVSAADLASRSVAAYCETMNLPVEDVLIKNRVPLSGMAPSLIVLLGSPSTIGRRYTMEEARFRLKDLGMSVFSPLLDVPIADDKIENAAMIVLADGMDHADIRAACASHPFMRRIVLDEDRRFDARSFAEFGVEIMHDFASALYHVSWPGGLVP